MHSEIDSIKYKQIYSAQIKKYNTKRMQPKTKQNV